MTMTGDTIKMLFDENQRLQAEIRILNLAIANATQAANERDRGKLGTVNESIQALVDAFIGWTSHDAERFCDLKEDVDECHKILNKLNVPDTVDVGPEDGVPNRVPMSLNGRLDELVSRLEQSAKMHVDSINERVRLQEVLLRLRTYCRIVYYPAGSYGGEYPIEHAPGAKKDSWDMILAGLARRKIS